MVVMKFCNHGISKTISAKSFKLAQLIDYLVKMKTNHFIIFELLPFANLDIDNLISQKPLQLGGSNLVSLLRIRSRLPGENEKKIHFIFLSYRPLQILSLKT